MSIDIFSGFCCQQNQMVHVVQLAFFTAESTVRPLFGKGGQGFLNNPLKATKWNIYIYIFNLSS